MERTKDSVLEAIAGGCMADPIFYEDSFDWTNAKLEMSPITPDVEGRGLDVRGWVVPPISPVGSKSESESDFQTPAWSRIPEKFLKAARDERTEDASDRASEGEEPEDGNVLDYLEDILEDFCYLFAESFGEWPGSSSSNKCQVDMGCTRTELRTALVETLEFLCNRSGTFLLPLSQPQLIEEEVFYDYAGLGPDPRAELTALVEHLMENFRCSESAFLVALIFMERLEQSDEYLRVNQYNVRRLFIASLVVACKTVDDEVFINSYYAKSAGIEPALLNQLEMGLLGLLEFRTFVGADEYRKATTE